MDFSNQEAVFKDLQSKYGERNVAKIVAFGTMTPKAVFRKVMSTFGHEQGIINFLSKQIPDDVPDIQTAISVSRELTDASTKYAVEFAVMCRLQGTISHESQHAGGIVIYNDLYKYLPIKTLAEDRSKRICAFDMDMLHELHFFKFDILGLETINIIHNTIKSIENTTGKKVDLYNIDYDDENVYDMLCKGDVSGVFQISNQQEKVVRQQPRNFKDLIAINALIRPGVGDFEEYVARRGGKEYELHTLRENYMKETEGTIVYQEQFLLDCQVFAGWDIAFADANVRKNKKILEDYELRDKFYKDCLDRRHSKELIETIWSFICDAVSGGYGFNKSHSATYAMTAFQTAWLKYYYPEHFYASLMSSEDTSSDGQIKIGNYIAELRNRGITVNPPDINVSNEDFVVTDRGINYRLTAITHVGKSAIKGIQRIRPIKSLSDLLERRVKKDVKSNTIVNIIKAGCFDFENPNRAEMMYEYQISQTKKPEEVVMYEWNDKLKCKWEKEALGLYLSAHPMEKYGFKPFEDYNDGQYDVLQGGEVASIKIFNDKNRNEMAFVNLDTLYGTIRIVVFASMWEKENIKNCFEEDNIIMVKGKKDGNSLLLNEIEVLE